MSALGQATAIVALTRSLAEGLRTGEALVSDAGRLEQLLREAEDWLHSARRFLNPAVDRKAAPMADEPALTAESVRVEDRCPLIFDDGTRCVLRANHAGGTGHRRPPAPELNDGRITERTSG